jgi:hypothetical protein
VGGEWRILRSGQIDNRRRSCWLPSAASRRAKMPADQRGMVLDFLRERAQGPSLGPRRRRRWRQSTAAQTYSWLWAGWTADPPRESWAATIMKVKTHLEMMSMMV